MALNIEKADLAFSAQMKNLGSKIGKYASTLGLTATDVTTIQTDAEAFEYVLNGQVTVQTFAQNYTSFKNLLRKGGDPASLPVAPVPTTPPTMPAPNIEGRLRGILQRMVNHPAYSAVIGEDLGIEAPVETFVPVNGKPTFTIELSTGGYPNLRWTKGKYQGVEIWKDSGQGFAKLDRDMKPDYIDKSNLPAQGLSVTWKYKMIYLMNDEMMGSWSDIVTVAVQGEV